MFPFMSNITSKVASFAMPHDASNSLVDPHPAQHANTSKAPTDHNGSASNTRPLFFTRNESNDIVPLSNTASSSTLPRPTQSTKGKGKGKERELAGTWIPDGNAISAPNPIFPLSPVRPKLGPKGVSRAGTIYSDQPAKAGEWIHQAQDLYGDPKTHLQEMFSLSQRLVDCAQLFAKAWPIGVCPFGVPEFIDDVFCHLPRCEAQVGACAQILARKINERFEKQPFTIVEKIDLESIAPPPMLVADPTTGIPLEIPQVRVQTPHLKLAGDELFKMQVGRRGTRRYSGNYTVEFRPQKPSCEGYLVPPPPGFGVKVVEGKTEEYNIYSRLVPCAPMFGYGASTSLVHGRAQKWEEIIEKLLPRGEDDQSQTWDHTEDALEPPPLSGSSVESQLEVDEVALSLSLTARSPSPSPSPDGEPQSDENGQANHRGAENESSSHRSIVAAILLARRLSSGRGSHRASGPFQARPSLLSMTERVVSGSPVDFLPTEDAPASTEESLGEIEMTVEAGEADHIVKEPAPIEELVVAPLELIAIGKAATKKEKRTMEKHKEEVLEVDHDPMEPSAAEGTEDPDKATVEFTPTKMPPRGKGKAKAAPRKVSGRKKAKEILEGPATEGTEPAIVKEAPVPAPTRSQKRFRREFEEVVPKDGDFNRPIRRLRSSTKTAMDAPLGTAFIPSPSPSPSTSSARP